MLPSSMCLRWPSPKMTWKVTCHDGSRCSSGNDEGNQDAVFDDESLVVDTVVGDVQAPVGSATIFLKFGPSSGFFGLRCCDGSILLSSWLSSSLLSRDVVVMIVCQALMDMMIALLGG